MRLKIATFSLLIADVILFITAGFFLAAAPMKNATRGEAVSFVVRSYAIVVVLLLSVLATVIFAYMWAQSLRDEYREEARQNLEALIEGTLQDHGRKES